MSVFVDTGVFYAHHDTDASRHEVGVTALNRVLRSAEYGRVMTSDYVYDEVVTLTHRRTGTAADGIEVGRREPSSVAHPNTVHGVERNRST